MLSEIYVCHTLTDLPYTRVRARTRATHTHTRNTHVISIQGISEMRTVWLYANHLTIPEKKYKYEL